jgi:hypothetical protein
MDAVVDWKGRLNKKKKRRENKKKVRGGKDAMNKEGRYKRRQDRYLSALSIRREPHRWTETGSNMFGGAFQGTRH